MKTAVGIQYNTTKVIRHDITPVIGNFNSNLICYLPGLEEVSLKDVPTVDPMQFVESLPWLKNLNVLLIENCYQFHESHFSKVAENNPSLKYLDVSNSAPVSFSTVHFIMGTLKKLVFFGFEPKFPNRVDEWKQILRIFQYREIEFTSKVKNLFEKD